MVVVVRHSPFAVSLPGRINQLLGLEPSEELGQPLQCTFVAVGKVVVLRGCISRKKFADPLVGILRADGEQLGGYGLHDENCLGTIPLAC